MHTIFCILQEPNKYEVLAFQKGGARPARRAMCVLQAPPRNSIIEAVVDLEGTRPIVISWKEVRRLGRLDRWDRARWARARVSGEGGDGVGSGVSRCCRAGSGRTDAAASLGSCPGQIRLRRAWTKMECYFVLFRCSDGVLCACVRAGMMVKGGAGLFVTPLEFFCPCLWQE